MKRMLSFLALAFFASALASAQTGVTISPGPTSLPTNTAGASPATADQVFLVRENGDLLIADSTGQIKTTLPASMLPADEYFYRVYATATLPNTIHTVKPVMDSKGVVYFGPAGAASSAIRGIYRWNQNGAPVKLLSRAGSVLTTNGGMVTFQGLDGPGVDSEGRLLFITNNSRLIRRTEVPGGDPIYMVLQSATGGWNITSPITTAGEDIFFTNYLWPDILNATSQVARLRNTTLTSFPQTLDGFWQSTYDPTRKEVLGQSMFLPNRRFSSSTAKRFEPEPVESLLDAPNTSPMASNGLRLHMTLDNAWNGRTFISVWDGLSMRDEAAKVWRKVLHTGDKIGSTGPIITGIKLVVPFAQHAFVLTNEGWLRLTPTFAPPAPTINFFTATPSSIYAGEAVTLAWNTSDASDVRIDQEIGSVRPSSGDRIVAPASTTTYTLTATSAGGSKTASVTVTVNPPPAVLPFFTSANVTSAAKANTDIAVGGLATVYGVNLSEVTLAADSQPLPTQLGSVSVTLDGNLCPLLYVSPGQINFQVPLTLGVPAQARMVVTRSGVKSAEVKVNVLPQSVTLFRLENGQPMKFDKDFNLITDTKSGNVVIFLATGVGATDPDTGQAYESVAAAFNNVEAIVLYAGQMPGFTGVAQINVLIPDVGVDPGGQTSATAEFRQGASKDNFELTIFN